MECWKRKFSNNHITMVSIITSLMGILLLIVSQAIYIQEKSIFQNNQTPTIFEESFAVKVLDVFGCTLLIVPLCVYIMTIGMKVWKRR